MFAFPAAPLLFGSDLSPVACATPPILPGTGGEDGGDDGCTMVMVMLGKGCWMPPLKRIRSMSSFEVGRVCSLRPCGAVHDGGMFVGCKYLPAWEELLEAVVSVVVLAGRVRTASTVGVGGGLIRCR